ncbi:MAG: hypothetical protein ACE5JS_23595 [Nitrospinota bacterium]
MRLDDEAKTELKRRKFCLRNNLTSSESLMIDLCKAETEIRALRAELASLSEEVEIEIGHRTSLGGVVNVLERLNDKLRAENTRLREELERIKNLPTFQEHY